MGTSETAKRQICATPGIWLNLGGIIHAVMLEITQGIAEHLGKLVVGICVTVRFGLFVQADFDVMRCADVRATAHWKRRDLRGGMSSSVLRW